MHFGHSTVRNLTKNKFDRNAMMNMNLPKISDSNQFVTHQSQQQNETKPKIKIRRLNKNEQTKNIEYNKQNMSTTKMKQFVKLFKNYNPNTRIFKGSPYCSTIFKNQLINAISTYKQHDNWENLKKTKRIPSNQRQGNTAKLHNLIITHNKKTNIHNQWKSEVKEIGKITLPIYIRKVGIQLNNHQQIELNVCDVICDEQQFLSVKKITQKLMQKIGGKNEKEHFRYKAIIGYSVSGLVKKKIKQTIQIRITNSQHMRTSYQETEQDYKGCLQTASYLLTIGKFDIKNDQYSYFQKIILKPLYTQKLKSFLKQNKHEKSNQQSLTDIKLNDFNIIKCLGTGGFSSVFLVRSNFNGKYYAMKLIDKKFILENERESIVQNQRFILQTLSTKKQQQNKNLTHFITMLSFCFETMHHFVFILEYCPGGQLFNQLKKVRKMREEQARFYFLEILIALDHIHSHNILYRDLKPQNLLIDAQGHIKIADFGLSKPLNNSKSFSYSFCGSPQYMAPQMLTKTGHNYLLDYYCLGALLYQLVVGVPPYYSFKQQEIYQAILAEELQFPNNIQLSSQIINLLSGLLNKDAKQRLGSLYGVKEIMYHPWIGKICRQTIEKRQLTPPFLPNLNSNNFDEEQIKIDLQSLMKKLKQDSENVKFSTHFSQQFTFIHPDQQKYFTNIINESKKRCTAVSPRKQSFAKSNSLSTYRYVDNSPYKSKTGLKDKQMKELSINHNNSKSVSTLKTLKTTQGQEIDYAIFLKNDKKKAKKALR